MEAGWRALVERHGETYLAGERIFQTGHDADALYVVVAGTVELSVRDEGGASHVVQELGAGEMFGECSCFGSGVHSASAVARARTLLVRLHRSVALDLIQSRPEFALRVINALAGRIVDSTARIGEMRAARRRQRFCATVEILPLQPGGRSRPRVA